MNVQKLQIDKKSFDAILAGEQKVEHRYIYPSNATRYVYFRCEGKDYKRQEDVPDNDSQVEMLPIKYDALYLINGRRKDARRMTIKVEKAEAVVLADEGGNDLTFEQNGETYLACEIQYHLGEVLSTENI